MEEQPSFSAVAKGANIMLNITEDMVHTPYKKIIRNVYTKSFRMICGTKKLLLELDRL